MITLIIQWTSNSKDILSLLCDEWHIITPLDGPRKNTAVLQTYFWVNGNKEETILSDEVLINHTYKIYQKQ